jgi:hypothetical protein
MWYVVIMDQTRENNIFESKPEGRRKVRRP